MQCLRGLLSICDVFWVWSLLLSSPSDMRALVLDSAEVKSVIESIAMKGKFSVSQLEDQVAITAMS